MSQVVALVCLMAKFLMIFSELMWLVPFWQQAWTRARVKWVEISLNFEPFKQLAHGYVEFTELPSRPRIGNRWCLRIYNIDCFLIGGVGCHFLRSVASFIDNIFHLSTSYDQGFEVGKWLGKEMFVAYGQQIFHHHLDFLFFIGPICHLGCFCPPSCDKDWESFLGLLLGCLQITPSNVHFGIVFVLLIELIANVLPSTD